MDFDETPQEAAFRAEARSWLESHAKEKGSEMKLSLYHDPSPEAAAESVRRSKEWQRTLYDGGWAGITWPKEYGGRGGTPIQQMIFDQEQASFDVSAGAFAVGIGMVGPTLIAHGTEEQKKRYLEPLLRGDEVWCQLFSEPGAGSDLAGLGTRAVRDGDEWVVNGQKVWNSGAHHSELGILLARTDPTEPKHGASRYFLVDMSTPGIDVRPLRADHRGGPLQRGLPDRRAHAGRQRRRRGQRRLEWRATTLANERTLIGGARAASASPTWPNWPGRPGGGRPGHPPGAGRSYTRFELLRYLGYASDRPQPGPDARPGELRDEAGHLPARVPQR